MVCVYNINAKGGKAMHRVLVISAIIASNVICFTGAAYSWKRSGIGNPRMDFQKCNFAASKRVHLFSIVTATDRIANSCPRKTGPLL